MDSFKLTVLGIAMFSLIVIFIIVGVIMKHNSTTATFPPKASNCPNYWKETADGKCIIPVQKENPTKGLPNIEPINIGSGSISKIGNTDLATGVPMWLKTLSGKHGGTDANGNMLLDFSELTSCQKQTWANQYGILWDGINNINTC